MFFIKKKIHNLLFTLAFMAEDINFVIVRMSGRTRQTVLNA